MKNTDLPDHDLSEIKADSVHDCQEKCIRHPDCNFYSYRQSDGNCWQKTSDAGKSYSLGNGFVSGARDCSPDCKIFITDLPDFDTFERQFG